VAADVIRRAEDLEDPEAIVAAIAATQMSTIVGKVDWSDGPMNNVTKTPLAAGQWQKTGDTFNLEVVASYGIQGIEQTADLKLLS
ncbi:MAG: ABC transporter substrate-binding protein, partial [Pseudomonadota bacterium]|nr:ABC transporter substrate-binding protein [Pseudomonadota bacterium]